MRVVALGLVPALVFGCSAAPIAADNNSALEDFAVDFAPLVAGAKFSCSTEYAGIGKSKTTFKPLDFRMFVTDVALVRQDGVEVPLTLTGDNVWQRGKFALLDFEDGTGTCEGGTSATNYKVKGRAPRAVYTGVVFTVGIPDAENHLDAATAPAPLNAPGMWWSWKGGYKYMRLDVQTPKNKSYYLHLGASDCKGTVAEGYTCASGNQPRIRIDNLDTKTGKVGFDIADLWADVDLDAQIDGKTDFVSGCMAFAGDPECPMVFDKLGLTIEGKRLATYAAFKGIK
jgi:uncharacterized repeat protein (TIGR04052 family)